MDQSCSQPAGCSSASAPVSKRTRVAWSPSHSSADVNPTFVVNELLCYAMKKFNQLNGRMLRQVILDFYDTTQLSTAKEVLSNALTDLKLETWVGVTYSSSQRKP